LGNIVRGQVKAQVDDPRDQPDHAAHHQGQPIPSHAICHQRWIHFFQRTLQPLNQVARSAGDIAAMPASDSTPSLQPVMTLEYRLRPQKRRGVRTARNRPAPTR
jgi:hypothetical protein